MCTIFSGQDSYNYINTTRSIRICGHVTSIRLENKFWDILNQLSKSQGETMAQFLSKLYLEALDNNMDMRNFTSLLRCSCLIYLETKISDDNIELIK